MEKSNPRLAAVAGQFYPASIPGLKNQIETFIDKKAVKSDALACMLPHAGYIYSGRVAAETLSCVKIREKIILLGPNHTGYGPMFSLMAQGSWQTPLGEIKIDTDLAQQILKHSPHLQDDASAHTYEHSLEVELPILQYFKAEFEIVPMIFLSNDIDALKQIGKAIAMAVEEAALKDSTLVVASSDMTHYEPQAQAQKKDQEAIKAILELNEDKLAQKIQELNISMCGWAPVIAMLSCAKALGAKNAKLIKYQTSGEVTGDRSAVVGYAGIIIY